MNRGDTAVQVENDVLWLEGSSSNSNDGLGTDQPQHNGISMETNLDKKRASQGKAHSGDQSDDDCAEVMQEYLQPPLKDLVGRFWSSSPNPRPVIGDGRV